MLLTDGNIAAAEDADKERPTPEEIACLRSLKERGWAEPTPAFYRRVLPEDAFATHDHVTVFPDYEGGWAVFETNSGGGSQYQFASKEAALAFALEFVRRYNSELKVVNRSIYPGVEGEALHAS